MQNKYCRYWKIAVGKQDKQYTVILFFIKIQLLAVYSKKVGPKSCIQHKDGRIQTVMWTLIALKILLSAWIP